LGLPSSLVFLFTHATLLTTPAKTLGNLTFYGCSVWASVSSTPSPSALLDLTRLYQASKSAVSLTAYVMPCVRFNRFVRWSAHLLHDCNSQYEWLVRPYSTGLSPNQKYQALLGAPMIVHCGRIILLVKQEAIGKGGLLLFYLIWTSRW